MNKFVSIIMPNYNCSRFIAQTIESVISQTYQNWELLIVDDKSTDGSVSIIQKYQAKDSRIKLFINKTNSGASYSRNTALLNTKGVYIAFLDSDDLWVPNKLEKQVKFMDDNDCDFSYTEYSLIDEDNGSLGRTAKVPFQLTYKKMLFHCYTGCLTVMYKSDLGSFQGPNIKNNNDYGLFLQILKKSKKALGIKENLAFYRIRNAGISRNKLRKVKPYYKLMIQYQHKNALIASFYLFTNILIGKIWKYKKNEMFLSQEKCTVCIK